MAKKNTKSKKSKSKRAVARPPKEPKPLPQEASKLMQLPQELRDKIYSEFFSQIRFVDGRRLNRHAPALLRTCRRIRSEIEKTWLQHVIFSFNSSESMLNTLTKFSPETLSQVRHVRVESDFLRINLPANSMGSYQTHAVLQLLPGLKLDRLELDPFMFGFGADSPFRRRPQPADWQSRLEARDGKLSKPSVAIYRAKTTDGARDGIPLDPDEGVPLVQKLAEGQTLDDFDAELDECIRDPREIMKKSLVIVKRGEGVDYVQRYDCAGTDYDIRAKTGKTKWEDIKKLIFRLGYDGPEFDDNYDDDDDYDLDFEDDYLDDDDSDVYGLEDSEDEYDDSDDDDLPALEPVHV
ncbi:hypothetical protein HDK64DRAFT_333994 [Phyllosticta capitalensis]